MPESVTIAERSIEMQRSPEFQRLRRTFLTFILPMTVLFLAWYLAYVLIAGYAPDFFATRLGESHITVGLLFGLGQFASTFAITMLYSRWANRVYDPVAEPLAAEMERAQEGER
ncbi:DUF485 domain-containing protein [Agrococcus carbonis]|uniref:Uncharacterized membrane protein, DUF485 family n=1 Tax=Agrococcus carbonis TaxID=684552 RepID=A0A1H1MND2_9MICO|nr:DUF485 domain-containing protein [Agrococcus carbonis]SDR88291.1 Uncharacterized membrane protein, DUF485 family [Agrococcus carbonis]